MWVRALEGRGGRSIPDALVSLAVQGWNDIGAEGMKTLTSAIAQGHTPNLQWINLVSGWRGCDGEEYDGGQEEQRGFRIGFGNVIVVSTEAV